MQKISSANSPSFSSFLLPAPDEEILPGIKWGKADEAFSSAYWASIARMTPPQLGSLRIGCSLREEVAACLLGGYGMRAEVGLAAFFRLRALGLLEHGANADEISKALAEPIPTIDGKHLGLRFARKKAHYIVSALHHLDRADVPDHSSALFRDWLRTLPGIGWKTASWITRNWLSAEDVAILDVHVMKAGVIVGLFPQLQWCDTNYLALEARFLSWAKALGTSSTHLDDLIWKELRLCPRFATSVAEASLTVRQQGQYQRQQTYPQLQQ